MIIIMIIIMIRITIVMVIVIIRQERPAAGGHAGRGAQDLPKGGAVETGCSDLYAVMN